MDTKSLTPARFEFILEALFENQRYQNNFYNGFEYLISKIKNLVALSLKKIMAANQKAAHIDFQISEARSKYLDLSMQTKPIF